MSFHTNQSIIEKHTSENLPCPLFAKEGKFLPFAKGGKEGLEGRCLDNYGLFSNSFSVVSEVNDSQLKGLVIRCLNRAILFAGLTPLLISVFWEQDGRLYARKQSERSVSRHRLQTDPPGIFGYAPFDVFALPLQSGFSFFYLKQPIRCQPFGNHPFQYKSILFSLLCQSK
jgi:hypothetical protein